MLKFYKLELVEIPDPKPGEFVIRTAAVWPCALCGRPIDGMGGPGDGEICVPCGDLLRSGKVRGAIIYDEDSKP